MPNQAASRDKARAQDRIASTLSSRKISTLEARESKPTHTVDAIEQITIPDWDNSNCPWCQEGRILDDIMMKNPKGVSKTPIFGQPSRRTCDLVNSGTCKTGGEGDFGQLR
jgi:hypothetical protein